MSSSASASEINPFLLLDQRIQHWIWSRGWTELRAVQELAIPALLAGNHDVILAAATSAGKTEAAFFPILTQLLKPNSEGRTDGGFVLSISPLKALINDQQQRLQDVCRHLDLPVLGWHGDVPASRKQRFLRNPSGVLIITPESLEALFVTRGTAIPGLAALIKYIVIDELHSFLGTERGKQLQSLMARIELAAQRTIPRVGLSATLGDMRLAAEFLRPGSADQVETIDAGGEPFQLQLIVKGYIDDQTTPSDQGCDTGPQRDADAQLDVRQEADEEEALTAESPRFAIATYLYKHLRGTNNLIFPNSRAQVEFYADLLRRHCEGDGIPNQFWAHHGSLSRELREDAESALKSGSIAATAVCTTTLELGIDIGSIRSVAQIGPPPSVASLRQRLGRSGRKQGESAILRCFSIERKLTADSSFSDRLREGLLETTAMVSLLLRGWVEPPRPGALHASTLVQQILSVIAQRGGATASELWHTLIASGTFDRITREDLLLLLRALREREMLQQESSGLLLPGPLGERLINHYDFYSAFVTTDEFRVITEGNTLGSLPLSRPLTAGQRIIFAGRRWRVDDVDTARKVIAVRADRGGVPPIFDGTGFMVHDRVRQEMLFILGQSASPSFLDSSATALLAEAQDFFRSTALGTKRWFLDGNGIVLLTWRGDFINDALALLLTAHGLEASNEGVGLRVHSTDAERLDALLRQIAASPIVTPEDLRLKPQQTYLEKWDWVLPEGLRLHSFASQVLDLEGAKATVCSQAAKTVISQPW